MDRKIFKNKNLTINAIWTKPIMTVIEFDELNKNMFPDDNNRKACGMCKTEWIEMPLLEGVYYILLNDIGTNVCRQCFCIAKEIYDNK